MITLAADCMFFQFDGGESVPFSADMVSVELMGESALKFDEDFVRHATKAVFHYFKEEMGCKTVTIGEFAGALEKVLDGFKLEVPTTAGDGASNGPRSDLHQLARDSGAGGELAFYLLLREEMRRCVRQGERLVRFHGLRGAVKELVGAQRWSWRCRTMEEQIITYLRECFGAEARPGQMSMVVE